MVKRGTGETAMRVRWGRPLLGDAGRTWAWLALAACVIVVVTLGLLLRGQAGPDGFDGAVDARVIAAFGGHYGLLLWLARPATSVPAIAISAASAAGCLIAGRLNGVVLAVTAVPVAAALDDVLLKPLFHRTLHGQLAFPSGHAASVAAQTAMLAVLLLVPPQRQRTRTARVTLVTVYCVITAALGTAVIALGWHYFTDAVAGVAAGAGAVLALALLLDLASGVVHSTRKLPDERSPACGPEIRTGPGGGGVPPGADRRGQLRNHALVRRNPNPFPERGRGSAPTAPRSSRGAAANGSAMVTG